MKTLIATVALVLSALTATAGGYRDSGIGSYSNAYGHGWTKVCCDYPYYHPYSRLRRPRVR